MKGDAGEMTIKLPKDRNGTFEPQLIGEHRTRSSMLPLPNGPVE